MEQDVKDLLQQILLEIGKTNQKIDVTNRQVETLDQKIEEVRQTSERQFQELLGLVASLGQDVELISGDIRYLVQREADNRHSMMLLNKRFNRNI